MYWLRFTSKDQTSFVCCECIDQETPTWISEVDEGFSHQNTRWSLALICALLHTSHLFSPLTYSAPLSLTSLTRSPRLCRSPLTSFTSLNDLRSCDALYSSTMVRIDCLEEAGQCDILVMSLTFEQSLSHLRIRRWRMPKMHLRCSCVPTTIILYNNKSYLIPKVTLHQPNPPSSWSLTTLSSFLSTPPTPTKSSILLVLDNSFFLP